MRAHGVSTLRGFGARLRCFLRSGGVEMAFLVGISRLFFWFCRWGEVRRVGCDPAGSARNEQTGESSVNRLRGAGFKVACRGSQIQDGLEMIRAGLCSGAGEATLFVHPRCKKLVQAMRTYRYGEGRAETPVKDGADHLVDALRYYFVSRDVGEVIVGRY